jgi:hypothetical protein
MSQNTARHDPHARSDEEDVADVQARQSEHRQGVRPGRPLGQPVGDGGVGEYEPDGAGGDSPDEPDEGECELIGDDDLGAADLGPAAPNARDPDAGSGRVRKII